MFSGTKNVKKSGESQLNNCKNTDDIKLIELMKHRPVARRTINN